MLISVLAILVAEVLLLLDFRQTLYIAQNPGRFYEINRLLGPHPSVPTVCLYFLGCMAVLAAGCYYFEAAGFGASVAVAILEAYVVVKNRKLFGAWW